MKRAGGGCNVPTGKLFKSLKMKTSFSLVNLKEASYWLMNESKVG